MINPCTQTGAVIYIEPRGETYRGDAFEVSDVMYFRLNEASVTHEKGYGPPDWIVENWTSWFDRGSSSGTSTMICDTLQTRKGTKS